MYWVEGEGGGGNHVRRSIRMACDKLKCIMAKTCSPVYFIPGGTPQILYRGSVTGNLQMFSDIEDSSVYYEICLGSTVEIFLLCTSDASS
jgi:hypothetical protein